MVWNLPKGHYVWFVSGISPLSLVQHMEHFLETNMHINEKGRWDHHLPRWGIWHDMTTYLLDLKPTWITPKSSPRNIMNLLKGLWIESQQHGAHRVSKFPDGFGSRSPRKKKSLTFDQTRPSQFQFLIICPIPKKSFMAILGMVHYWHYSKYNFPLFHLYHDSPIIILSLSHRCPYWKEITPHVSSNKSQNKPFIFYYIVSHYSTYMEVSINGDPNSWMLYGNPL